MRKLQIGSGQEGLNGWLNTDIEASVFNRVIYVNAARRFPLADSTFDYVFSEHLIEHLSYEQGLSMLRECHRILKPGGVLRIATPDLKVLLGLHTSQLSPAQERYIRWVTDNYMPSPKIYGAVFIINNAFRNWGHQFLYDEELLRKVLCEEGFSDIRRYRPGESDNENLRNIETHGKNTGNEEANSFETMVFEATCQK